MDNKQILLSTFATTFSYGCLESSVRNNYLENLDYDTPEPRISLDLARELVLYRSSSSGQGADDKSLALWKILNAMQEHFR